MKNKLLTLVTPDNHQEENALWIHQDAYISSIYLEKESQFSYVLRIPGNGVFVYVIEGEALVQGNKLGRRDAIGISASESFQVRRADARILFVEIPMK